MGFSKTKLLIAHFAVSWALFGLIWTVQLVHYPTFRYIPEGEFPSFQHFHMQGITLIVMPLMLAELALSGILALRNGFRRSFGFTFALVAAIWLSTFFWQVPLHNALTRGKDPAVIGQLVYGNWLRTALWSLKTLIVSRQLWRVVAPAPARPATG